ncbi:hypothetical protein AAG570_013412 [Ranatra chinensis]|uniref:alanine transaminase n=1 Tax=Ranatra chinensis TaxID=642074 RepID=A0ABD0YUM7_9HEMI
MSDEIDGKKPAILLPTPEYPLFSASLQEHGVQELRYKLNEDDVWAIDIDSAYEAVEEGKRQSYQPRAIVIINPGNPTGKSSLNKYTYVFVEHIIIFIYIIIYSQVYQELAYFDDHPFHSFKKVLKEMGHPYSDSVQLCSFMSSSKGVIYESGLRGGFMEMTNVDDSIRKCLTTVCSAQLCANTIGQVAVDVMVKPPVPGEPSYQLYNEEKTIAMDALKRKSKACCDFFNSLEGVHCNPIRSGYYAFPRVDIPPRAVKDAEAKGMDVDTYYLMELLEETGISYAPGSAFGQAPGTHHLR